MSPDSWHGSSLVPGPSCMTRCSATSTSRRAWCSRTSAARPSHVGTPRVGMARSGVCEGRERASRSSRPASSQGARPPRPSARWAGVGQHHRVRRPTSARSRRCPCTARRLPGRPRLAEHARADRAPPIRPYRRWHAGRWRWRSVRTAGFGLGEHVHLRVADEQHGLCHHRRRRGTAVPRARRAGPPVPDHALPRVLRRRDLG